MTKITNILQKNKIIRIAAILILTLMAAISVWKGCMNAYEFSQDFQWDAAKALSMGINPYDESMSPSGALMTGQLGDFYSRFEDLGAPQKMEANQFPSLLMLLLPMTLFTPDTARVMWIVLNLVFTGMIIYFLKKTFLKDMDGYTYALMSLLMMAGTPYRNQIGVGQHTLFAFAFFLLAVWCADVKNSPVGTTLALFVCYFKYTLTAPLILYFIYRKKIKEIVVSAAMHIVLTVVSALMLKDSVINMILKPLKVASVLSSEGGIDLGAVFGGSSIAFILAGVIAILLFMLTIMAPKGCGNLIFVISLLWSLILTYHRTYDFFVLTAASALLVKCDEMPELVGKAGKIVEILYLPLLLMSFFVLRIFSENTASRLCLGIIYYVLTVELTFILINIVKEKISLPSEK